VELGEHLGSPTVVLAAIVPALLLMWFFHSRDVFREPGRVLWTTFFLGVGCVALAGLTLFLPEWFFPRIENPIAAGAYGAFLSAAIPEELAKITVLLGYAARHDEFDEPMDGIVYGVAVSLGFATWENLVFVEVGGIEVAGLRAITAVPCHAFLCAIMGYYVGQARLHPERRKSLLAAALLNPILLHGLYDLPFMADQHARYTWYDGETPLAVTAARDAGVTVVLLIGLVWTWILVQRLRRDQLRWLRQREERPSAFASLRRRRWLAWLVLIIGGLLAVAGGLLVAWGLSGSTGSRPPDSAWPRRVVLAIAPLLVLGTLMFGLGIRQLNRTDVRGDQPGYLGSALG